MPSKFHVLHHFVPTGENFVADVALDYLLSLVFLVFLSTLTTRLFLLDGRFLRDRCLIVLLLFLLLLLLGLLLILLVCSTFLSLLFTFLLVVVLVPVKVILIDLEDLLDLGLLLLFNIATI